MLLTRHLQALSSVRKAFEPEEPEIANLIDQAVSLLTNSSRIPFDQLTEMNERQITAQLDTLQDEHKVAMLEAMLVERDAIVERILSSTPNTIRALALARAMEQVWNADYFKNS